MADLAETETYEAGIYQLEITDPVIGGPDGIDNLQAKQLANRTNWLKANKQDKDVLLTALAALTTAADKLIYATGVDTFSITTLTAFARTLLDDADAATMRATLGVQASDATLTALAALTTAADKLIYATGVDTFSITTLTAFARTLLDDADAATMRATLGVIDGFGVGQTWQAFTSGTRVSGTTYTNSTGKPIAISVSASGINSSVIITVNGVTVANQTDGSNGSMNNHANAIVPVGGTYSVMYSPTFMAWVELR